MKLRPVCPYCGAADMLFEIDRVAVLQKVQSVTYVGEVELVNEPGEVDWECQYPRDNPPEFQCRECGRECSREQLLSATRQANLVQ